VIVTPAPNVPEPSPAEPGLQSAFACPPRAIRGSARAAFSKGPTGRKIDMSSEGTPNAENRTAMPNLQVVGQFIKDLSFENPGAAAEISQRPQIELAVDLNAKRLADEEMFEVELKIRVNATNENRPLFLLEVAYAGVFRLQNVPDTATQQAILLIQAPHMLFPFVRRIVSDVVRDGGMPPLMIEPIDFMALYQARVAQGAQQPQGNA
jgi:preprotein translocase subunit SecB